MADRAGSWAADSSAKPRQSAVRGAWHLLWWLTIRQRGRALRGALFGTLWMLTLTAPPYVLQMAIDHGLQRGHPGQLIFWVMVLIAVAVVTAWLAIMRHRTMTWVRMDAAFRTIRLVNDQAIRLGHTLGRQERPGEVAAIGLGDSWTIGRCLTATGPGVGAVVTYAVTAVLLFRVSPLMAAVVLLGVPVLAVIVGPVLPRLTRTQMPYREQQAALTDQSLDIAGGLQVLNAVGGKTLLRERFNRRSAAVRDLGYRVGAVVSVIDALTVALPTLYLAVVVWLAARLAAQGTITIGELVAVYGYAAILSVPVTSFMEAAVDFSHAMVPARRVIAFLALTDQAAPSIEPAPRGPAPLVDSVTGVRVDPGSFTVVATARQADARGIVDRLAGLEAGGLWNGAPTVGMPAERVRERLLVADDDAALFAGSLALNVAGRSDIENTHCTAKAAPSMALHDALTVASAADVVAGLDGGWDGLLTSGGSNLSGGQRQRVRLARAVAADTEVLLAVDPTSALDAHTETMVASRLRSARRGRTTVVTSTSPLVLEQASIVHFVVANRVVVSGTHRQLLADPRYRDLVIRGEQEQAS